MWNAYPPKRWPSNFNLYKHTAFRALFLLLAEIVQFATEVKKKIPIIYLLMGRLFILGKQNLERNSFKGSERSISWANLRLSMEVWKSFSRHANSWATLDEEAILKITLKSQVPMSNAGRVPKSREAKDENRDQFTKSRTLVIVVIFPHSLKAKRMNFIWN